MRRIWSGMTLGILTGVALHFANKLPRVPTLVEMFDTLPAAAVLTVALGMLGGVTAKLTGPRRRRLAGDERREQKQRP
jgi:hypothetical protein